ncbi:MAG: hypothetical protein HYZ73_09775, partial [Elusimicrobia bacterium]|nr:hypothetical protein [Elusimicrobiota bacterium]
MTVLGIVRYVLLLTNLALFFAPAGWTLTTGQNADGPIIGQPNFTTPSITGAGLNLVGTQNGIYVDSNGKLFITDVGNNRVLIYNSVPTASGAAANVVVGQASMNANLANQGLPADAATLNSPRGVFSDGTNRPWRVKSRPPSLLACQALEWTKFSMLRPLRTYRHLYTRGEELLRAVGVWEDRDETVRN